MARPRRYPPELLDRGARLVFESNRPIARVARDLGVPSETLRKYVRQVEAGEGGPGDRPTTAEPEEINQLRMDAGVEHQRTARLPIAVLAHRCLLPIG
ncbi:MAG: transposase [Solirubrobacteraceae bacterium]|jgi:transposase|nr:transposase [Solirubrobacteraceae bacterium]